MFIDQVLKCLHRRQSDTVVGLCNMCFKQVFRRPPFILRSTDTGCVASTGPLFPVFHGSEDWFILGIVVWSRRGPKPTLKSSMLGFV